MIIDNFVGFKWQSQQIQQLRARVRQRQAQDQRLQVRVRQAQVQLVLVQQPLPHNETVIGVWNTTAGDDSTVSTAGSKVGNYLPSQTPSDACDNNINDEYTSFGACTSVANSLTCGLNTGFYRTPNRGPSLIIGLQICTSVSLPARDPITITFEGSNQLASLLVFGSSWTLIYNGSSGLDTDLGRLACGLPQLFTSNSVWYSNYRFLVTSKRGSDSATWYSEVQLIGY